MILLFNTKIQLKQEINELNIGASVIGEIPFIDDEDSRLFQNPKDRNILAESFRILSSNINYLLPPSEFSPRGRIGKTPLPLLSITNFLMLGKISSMVSR